MRRNITRLLAALAAAAVFAGLVHAVLVVAHVSEPAATTVYGLTSRRIWATIAAALGLGGVVSGSLPLVRPSFRLDGATRRLAGTVALVTGSIAAVNGGLNLAVASGGPGTGNGVIGGAAAVVLGMVAVTLGGLAFMRRDNALTPGN